jgi:hypothetical protein
LGDNAPDWYLSMDQFLQLVNEVVKASNNDWAFAGRNIHETAHPEDLAIGVVAAAEMVSLSRCSCTFRHEETHNREGCIKKEMKSEGQKQSRKHENRLAKRVGGSRTAASGAFWQRKGDVRSKELLIEHKWTGKKQVTIKSEVLKKITREAILDSRTPVLGIHLDGENYVILLEDDYLEMRENL